MKIEIWSDVMCPFCYIGKRRLEQALEQSAVAEDQVKITWKSFQLNPDLVTDPSINLHQHLADTKGWQLAYARQVSDQVTQMAAEVGLFYNMDSAVVANSFDAHRLSHLATEKGLGDAAEEALFKAYFTEGKNIADHDTLTNLGKSIGLSTDEIKKVLSSDTYADAVKQDVEEARYLGIQGVPFFVFNDKYAISGAQPESVFLETIAKALQDS